MRRIEHRTARTAVARAVATAAMIVLTLVGTLRASGANQRAAAEATNASAAGAATAVPGGAELLWRIRADRTLAGAAIRARSLALARAWRGARAILESASAVPSLPSGAVPSWDPYPPGQIRDLIVSVFTRVAGAGQVPTALCVAWRESRFDPYANNPSSSAAGLFQWTASSWSVYSSRYGFGGTSPYDAYANAAVAASAVADGGWGPWGGGC